MTTLPVPTCPLCGNGVFRELVSKEFADDQHLVRCATCGVVRLIGETPATPDYWEDDTASLHVYRDAGLRTEVRDRYGRYLRLITKVSGGRGTLLDAGCGIGHFLLAARDAGWQVAGVEVSAKAATIARSLGFDVETAGLENSRRPPGAFDVVTLWDIIEHLDDPVAALRVVHEKLQPASIVFLETPDEAFWARAFLRQAFLASRGRVDLLSYFYYPDHRFYFTRETLTRLLERAGFRNVQVWRDVTLPAKARLEIAPWRFPCRRVVLPLLPAFLGLMRRVGTGNKLMAAATKA